MAVFVADAEDEGGPAVAGGGCCGEHVDDLPGLLALADSLALGSLVGAPSSVIQIFLLPSPCTSITSCMRITSDQPLSGSARSLGRHVWVRGSGIEEACCTRGIHLLEEGRRRIVADERTQPGGQHGAVGLHRLDRGVAACKSAT